MTFTKDIYSPEALAKMQALVDELNEQTDRGVAIVGAAWVEESVAASLEDVLPKKSKGKERLFRTDGPISTFSAKIDFLHMLGLISEHIRCDMHRLREIRNTFAHQITHSKTNAKLGFHVSDIKDKCLALKCVEHERLKDPREAYIRACAILNADLEMLRYFGVKLLNDVGKVVASNERFED